MSENFNEYEDAEPSAMLVWAKRIVITVVVLVILYGLGLAFKGIFAEQGPKKKHITSIKILPDTPPPPPPPPPKEPPKDQPKDKPTEIKDTPKAPEAPPAPPQLNIEGAAGDAPSAFGSGAVNNDYKGGEIGNTIGGKKGLSAFAWYTGQIKTRIEDALAAEKGLTNAQYRLVVHVKIAKNGRVEKADLVGSTGDKLIDELIRKALAGVKPTDDTPPDDMPQPVILRITSRI